jgi:hypothetical protein
MFMNPETPEAAPGFLPMIQTMSPTVNPADLSAINAAPVQTWKPRGIEHR